MKLFRAAVYLIFLLLVAQPTARGQVSGQLSGTVVDEGGASVPDATVSVIQAVSKQTRNYQTQANGSFAFPGLLTGTYDLTIEKAGFRIFRQTGIVIATQENYDLHEIKLQIGDVSSSVTVSTEAARIQTDSSDRIQTVEQTVVEEVPNPTRSFLSATRTIPGSQSTSASAGGAINGGQTGQLVTQLDGISQQDSNAGSVSGSIGTGRFLVNLDAVSEIQVQVNAMNAEFGSRSGGQVNVTTKSGTNQFHGSIYMYLRNEDFNANSFFNNKTGIVRPRTRYQNPGGSLGGPVLLPWLPFNRDRTKMYFFYAEDQIYNKNAATQSYTMPTALEKAGDFSQTVTTKGVPIPIIDPSTGKAFSGNIIPPSRFSAEGLAMLNLFPTPGGASNSFGISAPLIIDPTGNRAYNTQSTFVTNSPSTTRTLRVDYNIGKNTTMYTRLLQSLQTAQGVGAGQTQGGTQWGQFVNTNPQNGRGFVVTVIHTFRPNLVGEFTTGTNFVHQQNQPLDPAQYFAAGDLSNFKYPDGTLVNPTQIFGGNFQHLIPNVNFTANKPQNAGQSYQGTVPSYGWDNRWPFDGTDQQSNYIANLTWLKGAHTIKTGYNEERVNRNVSVYSVYNTQGQYYFGTDTGNPNDTGYPISNLLTGAVQSFGQDNVKQVNHAYYFQYDWYVQDTWKMTRRLTVDYGMRFQVLPQFGSRGATLGLFDGALYNRSETGQLLFPKCNVALPLSGTCPVANTVAVNPITGKTYNGVAIGLVDPTSYPAGKLPYSGIQSYPNGTIFDTNHPQYGPRIGLAWDVFGDGKSAIRTAFGIYYNRSFGDDTIAAAGGSSGGPIKIPPIFQAPAFYDTTFAGIATGQPFFSPQTLWAGSTHLPNPTVYNWNFGIQRDLGKGLAIDASYVGNVAHHQGGSAYNANGIPVDTVWSPTGGTCNSVGNCTGTLNPAYINPAQTSQALPINLVRSYIGFNNAADLTSFTALGESYYDALQIQVNRRFSKKFTFSSNWTWAKQVTFSHNQYIPDHLTKNVTGRKQAVNINVNYVVPGLKGFMRRNVVTDTVFDGWHIDSVLSFFSGNPLTVGCSVPTGAPAGYPNGQDGVAGAVPFRCAMTGSLFLPDGATPAANGYPATTDPRLWYPVNIASFPLPALSTNGLGNTPPTLFWGPGFENIDVGIYKSFRIKKETNQLQLRADITNVLNHFNPADPNLTLSYNFANNAQQTAAFGQITSATGSARTMALSLRFRF